MQICITGSTGFLGSALARYWASSGCHLLLLTRPKSNINRISEIIKKYHSNITFLTITDVATTRQALIDFNPDFVIHAACSYGRCSETVVDLLKSNVVYGLELLEILASTNKNKTRTFINFDSSLDSDVSLYALSKDDFSKWAKKFVELNRGGVQLLNLKLQQMYGPDDDENKYIMKVVKTFLNNEPILPVTLGEQRRDFIYINDVVQACDTIIRSREKFPLIYDIDIGTGSTVSIREYVELVHKLTKSTTKIKFGMVPYRENEQMYCAADTREILRLGWVPNYSLEEGLLDLIRKVDKEVQS